MSFKKKLGALLVVALVGPFTAFSANLDWTGANNDNWFNGGNWTPGGPPGLLDNARIGNNTVAVGLARIATGATANANRVVLGLNAGESGTLRINNGSELDTVNNLVVGAGGDGTLIIENGSLRVNTSGNPGNSLVIGRDAGSNNQIATAQALDAAVLANCIPVATNFLVSYFASVAAVYDRICRLQASEVWWSRSTIDTLSRRTAFESP